MSATPAPALLSVQDLVIAYDGVTALRSSSFDVSQGEFVTLLGPSGSGKTSLLRAIAGFVQPASGSIALHGKQLNGVPSYRRNIGLVFQSYALFPHMSVGENIAFGLRQRRMPKDQARARTRQVLQYVRLEGFEDRRTYELSGGQQQRVAIARALAIQPDLLLLDEPMSNLDALLRASMQAELRGLLREAGVTAIYVTHNQEEALSMSDRVVVMNHGEIRQIGTPRQIYEKPVDTFVAGFVGLSNLIQRAGQTLMLRPERIRIHDASFEGGVNSVRGTVVETSYFGEKQLVRVRAGSEHYTVLEPIGGAQSQRGDTVVLAWQEESLVALEAG